MAAMDESTKLVESLRELLDEGRNDELAARLAEAHAADIARLLVEAPQERRVPLFRLLTKEQAGEVLPELDDQSLLDLVQALADIRKMAPEEGSFEVFVIDSHRHLVGMVPLRRLLTADPASVVTAIANADVVTVAPETDQEEVARIVDKYDLVAIPVVDRSNRLLGTISVENVVDIMRHEAS